MAEMVLRPRRRRKDHMLDARRGLPRPTGAQVKRVVTACVEAAPGFLLAMADVLTVPSGLHVAYIAALAALDRPLWRPVAGSAGAILLRLLCGLDPRWEGLLTLALLLAAPMVVYGRGNGALMGFTALTMLPTAIAGLLAPTAAQIVTGFAAVVVSALSAPLMYRGVKALMEYRHMEAVEERVSACFFAAMLLCGGARLLVLGVNAGALMAAGSVLLTAVLLGAGAACAAGMLAGVALALQGLPLMLSVTLSLGGLLAGVTQALGRRRLTCAAFALGTGLTTALSATAGVGCGPAMIAAAVSVALLKDSACERVQRFLRRFLSNRPAPGDAYAACMLAAWEKTVDAMALAVPSPVEREAPHSPEWWERRLCEGCPDMAQCGCMATELAAERAETVWDCREAADPIWQDALEGLRGLGCQRLYHLMQSMDCLRREDAQQRRSIRRACHQRDMLVTHLTAMAGAARRLSMLSGGESWWDEMTARAIRRELHDAAAPVRLSWVRRVQGHAQAAFELQFITGARRQAEELCGLVGAVIGAPVEVTRVDGDRVLMAERPLLTAECGVSSASIGGAESAVCGDTAWTGLLQDGRCMAALSDGMGHGEQAALASRQTVELLRLCLDAGYSRPQALTAVNGMMLLSGHGERFITVDLLTIDLWSGHAALDKLGAAGSWLYRQGRLTEMTGDALPVGILESIESRECLLRLSGGDAVVLLTDGVEEAFPTRAELEAAILLALEEDDPQAAAASLLASAARAQDGPRRDDQTAIVVRILKTRDAAPGGQNPPAGI